MDYFNAFWVGGVICALVQILLDKTKLMPATSLCPRRSLTISFPAYPVAPIIPALIIFHIPPLPFSYGLIHTAEALAILIYASFLCILISEPSAQVRRTS